MNIKSIDFDTIAISNFTNQLKNRRLQIPLDWNQTKINTTFCHNHSNTTSCSLSTFNIYLPTLFISLYPVLPFLVVVSHKIAPLFQNIFISLDVLTLLCCLKSIQQSLNKRLHLLGFPIIKLYFSC